MISYVLITSINNVHIFRYNLETYLLEILTKWLLLCRLRKKRVNDPEGFPNSSRALRDKYNL